MRRTFPEMRITVGVGGLLLLALTLLVMPLRWVAAWVLSTAVHELGHLLAARLLDAEVRSMELGAGGAKILTGPMNCRQELLCAIAGPAAGGVLILLGRWFPRLALCAGLQTAYNLLPLGELDGGRVLRCLAELLGIPHGERVCRAVEMTLLAALGVLGCYGSFVLRLGPLPVLWVAVMIFRVRREKALANRGN